MKRELDVWERTQGSRAGSLKQDSGAQIREKDFDGQAWSSRHDDTFRQLIANARKKAPVKPTTPPKAGSGMVDLTGSPSPSPMPNQHPEEPVEAQEDMDMAYQEDLLPQTIEESPTKQISRRRFFEESTTDRSELPPSSQYLGIASDITTVRPIQP